jgi:hypothetical protein
LVERCSRVLSVGDRDVSCGNNVRMNLNSNTSMTPEMWIW